MAYDLVVRGGTIGDGSGAAAEARGGCADALVRDRHRLGLLQSGFTPRRRAYGRAARAAAPRPTLQ